MTSITLKGDFKFQLLRDSAGNVCVYTSESHTSSVDKWQNITLKGDSKFQLGVSTCTHVTFCMFIYLTWGNSYNWIWHFAQYMNYITLEGRIQISVDNFFMYICEIYVCVIFNMRDTHNLGWKSLTAWNWRFMLLLDCSSVSKKIPFTFNLQLLSSMSLNLHLESSSPKPFRRKKQILEIHYSPAPIST